MRIVHHCDHSDQPDLHIRCSGKWTVPAWVQVGCQGESEGIFIDDEGELYAFDEDQVTCPACRLTMPTQARTVRA